MYNMLYAGESHQNTVAKQLGNMEHKHNLANTKANDLAY